MDNNNLPAIVVTGASGLIGRHFVDAVVNNFRLFCITRRSQIETKIPKHENIYWIQADIGKLTNINEIAKNINNTGGADYFLHLASYYDFNMHDSAEYENTNVIGTKNVLELSKLLSVKRFIFSSSLAACRFSDDINTVIDEKSPVDADFPYARSKSKGEKLVEEYSAFFPCTNLRLAAVYMDWCEYPPLYNFLETWLSRKWNSNILGGKGESSITYIHINDLIKIINLIIQQSDNLPVFCTLIASQPGTVSHLELYNAARKYFYGKTSKPIKIPKFFSRIGITLRYHLGKIIGNIPFERPWMVEYIDKKLVVENIYTTRLLNWQTTQRYDIIRRLLFIIENMKNYPIEWKHRNEAVLLKPTHFLNVQLYNKLIELRNTIADKLVIYLILTPDSKIRFPVYRKMDFGNLKWFVILLFQSIAVTIKSKDRELLKNFIQSLTQYLFQNGFYTDETAVLIQTLADIIKNSLLTKDDLGNVKHEISNYVNMLIQLTVDEMEDFYEALKSKKTFHYTNNESLVVNVDEIKKLITQMEDVFYQTKYYNFDKIFI